MSEKTFRAVHRRAPMTPRKARYVVDMVRGKSVNEALDILRFSPRRAAPMLSKVLMSALANAQQDVDVDHNRLRLVDVRADDGPTLRRWTPRSRGQMYPLLLRYCHLTVVIAEGDAEEPKRVARKAGKSRRARVAASKAADDAKRQKPREESAEEAAAPPEEAGKETE